MGECVRVKPAGVVAGSFLPASSLLPAADHSLLPAADHSAFVEASAHFSFSQAEAESRRVAPPTEGMPDLMDLMDAPTCLLSPMAPSTSALQPQAPLLPQPSSFMFVQPASFPQPAPLPTRESAPATSDAQGYAQNYPDPPPPPSASKRRSPRLVESVSGSARYASTPSKSGRWTPAKLIKTDAVDSSVKSGRKVSFKFPTDSPEDAAKFPVFELPTDPLESDNAFGAASSSSASCRVLRTMTQTTGNTTARATHKMIPQPRSLLQGGAMRNPSRRASIAGGVAKRPASSSSRRNSLHTVLGVPQGAVSRPRPAWQ